MELCTARIFVDDLAKARSFYANALRLSLTAYDETSGCCVFKAGAVNLIVESVPSDAPEEDLALAGAPERQAWGGTLATFRDPAGNGLQLVQRPAA